MRSIRLNLSAVCRHTIKHEITQYSSHTKINGIRNKWENTKCEEKKISSLTRHFSQHTLSSFLSFNSFRVNSSIQCTFSHWTMTFHGCCNVNHNYTHIVLIIFAKNLFTNHIHFVGIPFRIDLPPLTQSLSLSPSRSTVSGIDVIICYFDRIPLWPYGMCVISIFGI